MSEEVDKQRLIHKEDRDLDDDELNNSHVKNQLDQVTQEAQDEINRVQGHFENEIMIAKQERVELVSKIQELVAQNERLKVESNKQLSTYKSKYSEYKQKLRRANQNISTLMTRLAKFEFQLQSDKDERGGNKSDVNLQKFAYGGDVKMPGGVADPDVNLALAMAANQNNYDAGQLNISEILANDGLNDEIKRLLAENSQVNSNI